MVTLTLAATSPDELVEALDALTRRSSTDTPTGPGLATRRPVLDVEGEDVAPVVSLASARARRAG